MFDEHVNINQAVPWIFTFNLFLFVVLVLSKLSPYISNLLYSIRKHLYLIEYVSIAGLLILQIVEYVCNPLSYYNNRIRFIDFLVLTIVTSSFPLLNYFLTPKVKIHVKKKHNSLKSNF